MAAPHAASLSSLFAPPWPGGGSGPALSDSALSGLEWLLEGEEAASTGAQAVADAPAPQLTAEEPRDEVPLRCLDSTHSPACSRCSPAPQDADAAWYRLTNADGALMEKRLRSLLARCPEWNDPAERQRLAATLEAEELLSGESSGAVEVLRSHSCANMRKRAMLCLAHRWGYKGDCWSTREGVGPAPEARRSRKRTAPDAEPRSDSGKQLMLAPQRLQQTTLPLRDRTFIMHRAAQSHVLEVMTPHITAAARAWTGPHSAVHYGRARGEGMTWLRVRAIEGAVEVSQWMASLCRTRLGALRAWRETLSSEELRTPAYFSDAAFNSPESELEALRYITGQAYASTHGVAEAQLAVMGTLRAQDAAWVHDFDCGYENALAMIGAAHAFVATQRMEPLRLYLEASEAVLGGIVQYAEATGASLRIRQEWTSDAAATQGPAAGLRSEAQARVPPLVERLRLTGDSEHGVALLALATTPPPRGTPPQRFELAKLTP